MKNHISSIVTQVTVILMIFVHLMTINVVQAIVPSGNHTHKYLDGKGGYIIYTVTRESYVKDTLPNEWLVS